jgi:hypothetical protein
MLLNIAICSRGSAKHLSLFIQKLKDKRLGEGGTQTFVARNNNRNLKKMQGLFIAFSLQFCLTT